MRKIRVILGGMSAILADSLNNLIGAQGDMEVVASIGDAKDALCEVRRAHGEVLIVQGAEAPEPFSSVIATQPLRLLVIDGEGNGRLTRLSADSRTLNDISSERLLDAVRSVRAGATR